MSSDWSDTVFFAVCTPIESKPVTDVRHHPSPRVAEFKAVHSADMQFLEVIQLPVIFNKLCPIHFRLLIFRTIS